MAALARAGTERIRVLVLAAHPDDETIGVGATMAMLASAGAVVRVAHATDGAPRNPRLRPTLAAGSAADAADVRRVEERAALAAGGLEPDDVLLPTLGFVDQEAGLDLVALTRAVQHLFDAALPSVVVTHPYEGGHPDHDAVAFAAHAAVRLSRRPIALAEMTSYFASSPNGPIVTGTFAARGRACGAPPLSGWLADEDRELRRRMFASFESQTDVLSSFRHVAEPVRCAPEYDFTKPPPAGAVYYERLGFGWTAAALADEAARALRVLGLVRPP